MKIVAISMVRDEADIIATNILFHLATGIDEFLILDNGSSDATPRILRAMSRRTGRVRWTRDAGPYLQSKMTTDLARDAHRDGADWVLVIDGDEFWSAEGGLKAFLAQTPAQVLYAPVVNFIQRREQIESTPEALLTMTRRAPRPLGPIESIEELVVSQQIAFVEMEYPWKCVSRASADIEIHPGNHMVSGLGPPHDRTEQIVCMHAPLRSRDMLVQKAESTGSRVEGGGFQPGQAWHLRRWRRLFEQGLMDAEWAANSYADGMLDLFGLPRETASDTRLRDAVAPFVAEAKALRPRRFRMFSG